MNERTQFRLLTSISYTVIALSVFAFSVGMFMFVNLGKLGTALPVKTVNQFRNIANTIPLLSDLSSELDAIQTKNQDIDRKRLGFTVSKIKVAQGLIYADFAGAPPYDLKIIMDEITLLNSDLISGPDSNSAMSRENAILLKNRIDYIYAEFRDYILRINNATLSVLEKQRSEIENLKGAMVLSSLVAFSAAVLTLILVRNRRKLFFQLRKSRELAEANSNAKSEFLST